MYRTFAALVLMGTLSSQSVAPHVHPQQEETRGLLRSLRKHLEASQSSSARSLHASDFDGDGTLDVLASSYNFAHLYRGKGSGLFDLALGRFPEGVFGSLIAADFDGDGDQDLFGSEGVFLRNSAGHFSAEFGVSPRLFGTTIAADVDGDGDQDVIGRQNTRLLLLRADGVGGFTMELGLALPAIPQHFAAGDVDGDGSVDLLIAGSSSTHLALNNGNGSFTHSSGGLPPQTLRTNALVLFDVEGDGDLDAVLANEGTNALWLGDGLGTFTDASGSFPVMDLDTRGLALFDADDDGRDDIYFANYGEVGFPMTEGASDRLLLNNGDGTFADGSSGLPAWSDPSRIAVGTDLDGDGDGDLLVGSRSLRFLLGNGSGTFAHDDGGIPARWGHSSAVTFAHINGDPHLDAIVAGGAVAGGAVQFPLETSRILLGDGTGRFTDDTARLGASPPAALGSVMGDVDGDGDLDLVFAAPYDGDFIGRTQDNRLYLNDGNGVFSDVTSTHLPTHPGDDRGVTQAVRLFDIDGDSDLDLFFCDLNDYDGGGGGITFYEGDGSGHFTIASGFGTGLFNQGTHAFDFVDFDSDGDADIIARLELFGMTLIENQAGNFVDVGTRLPRGNGYYHAIYWSQAGDFDGDGRTDIVGAGVRSTGGPLAQFRFLLLGQAGGMFSDASNQLPVAAIDNRGMGAADIDGDGDLDLIGAELILENSGGARFHDRGSRVVGPASFGTAFADLDEDGDLDAFWPGTEGDFVGSNTTCHLVARGLPRVGKPMVFEIFGDGETPWRLATSPLRTRLSTPFGLLQVDPSMLSWVAAGVIPASGRTSWSMAVPANPSLVGTLQYWQAFVSSPSALTNVEVTLFTDR